MAQREREMQQVELDLEVTAPEYMFHEQIKLC